MSTTSNARTARMHERRAALVVGGMVALASLAGAIDARSGPTVKRAPPAPAVPQTTLRIEPRIARIRIDVAPGGAVVTHDLIFPRRSIAVAAEPLGVATLFASFTGELRPLAIEATRHRVDTVNVGGSQVLRLVDGDGAALTLRELSQRPSTAALILGLQASAGHLFLLDEAVSMVSTEGRDAAQSHAGDAGSPPHENADPFGVRIKSAIAVDTRSPRRISIMVRLGVRGSLPIAVEKIEVNARMQASLRGARAQFCGPRADSRPLQVVFPEYPLSSNFAETIPPRLAQRDPDDDLCVDVLM